MNFESHSLGNIEVKCGPPAYQIYSSTVLDYFSYLPVDVSYRINFYFVSSVVSVVLCGLKGKNLLATQCMYVCTFFSRYLQLSIMYFNHRVSKKKDSALYESGDHKVYKGSSLRVFEITYTKWIFNKASVVHGGKPSFARDVW
jgi:hypothetical protein